jgi:superfamily I DNA and/or RNA helicase
MLVVNKVLDLIKKRLFEPKDIGIISTYKAQSLRIKKIVRKKLAYTTPENRRLYEEIIKNIGTVDSFQ